MPSPGWPACLRNRLAFPVSVSDFRLPPHETALPCDKMAQKSATLLIVDDEKNTREGLRDALEDAFEVYTAADAEGALAVLETDPADVMITDLRLGADNGMELIERVLQRPKPPI